jgi:peptidoglycan/LPS O-acetylase OafA/YrhL
VILPHADSLRAAEHQQSRRSDKKHFRPDIEGLRAIAVLAVVLFHAAVPGLDGGYVGVDVFFVISGFLITGLLWREVSSTGSVRLRSFYGARARRLLPASALVGVITMIASLALLPPLQATPAISDGIASALYVSNYQFIARGIDYFGNHVTPSPFLHYWSLGVEEQFYLVWAPIFLGTAWLLRVASRRRTQPNTGTSPRPYRVVLTVIAVVSLVSAMLLTYLTPAAAFYSLPTRAWQLATGGLIALTVVHWQRLSPRVAAVMGWTGLALILWACWCLTPTTPYPGVAALLPTAGAALVIGAGCATPTQGCGRFLGSAPMRGIGRISYSWYLWHWPVLIFAPFVLGQSLTLTERITAALLSAGLAWLTLRYLENPLRFAPKIRDSAGRSLALGGVATAVAVAVGGTLLNAVPAPVGHGAPATPLAIRVAPVPPGSPMAAYDDALRQAFAQVQAGVAASADLQAVPSNLDPTIAEARGENASLLFDGCMRTDKQRGQPECAMADVTSPTTVALVGDSHAAMWTPAFQQLAAQRHWRLELLAKAGCPVNDVPLAKHLPRLVDYFRHCEEWRAQVVARLRAERPQLVVVSVLRQYSAGSWQSGFSPYDQVWLDSLTRLVKELRSAGSRVLVLGPNPSPNTPVPTCLSGHLDDATACAPSRSTAVNKAGIAAEAAATQAAGGHYADVTDLFCTAERCPVIVGNNLVYLDDSHLSPQYARVLAPAIGALADRMFAQK